VGSPGGVLHDPGTNAVFVEVMRERLDPRMRLRELEMAINDPAFAELAADTMLELLDRARSQDRQTASVTERREPGTSEPEDEP
jgi:Uncharacterised protein family (UPF0261)